jgi:16S rRNA (uracil1498-N3)-methyltransferase
MNDRLEWFLEKATEIGIDEITPIICDHSERKVVKTARLIKILQSAMKQSLQAHLPLLNEPLTFKQFLAVKYSASKYIAHCEPSKKSVFFNSIQDQKDILIIIGPEGDFSTAEIAAAIDHNFTPVSLGNTRLRTETAGIVACHTVALVH